MSDIRTILVTTDFSDASESAADFAKTLAAKFEADVVAMHVQELLIPPFVVEYTGRGMEEIEKEHEEQAQEWLRQFADKIGPDVELVIASGPPHNEIMRYAEDRKVDLIVMATHGRGFFSHAILGSTAERVLRHAPCPVLVTRGERE